VLQQFVDEGIAQRASVVGWDVPAFVHRDALPAPAAPSIEHTTLLSPFDNLIWHRERTKALWGFDYTLECYVPEPKRRYGYFTLPILRRGQLVGRLDPKAERQTGIFRVKAMYLEPDMLVDDQLAHDIAGALRACAHWHRTPEVVVERVEPAAFTVPLQQALRDASG
jgi:hypothetical protein